MLGASDAAVSGGRGQFARPARRTSVSTSAPGSTGLAMWASKPAVVARVRSASRAWAVRAIAGDWPGGAPLPLDRADLFDQLVPVLSRHRDVADQHVVGSAVAGTAAGRGRERPGGLGRRRGRRHVRPALLQQPADRLAGVVLVLDHQHPHAREHRRRRERAPRARRRRQTDAAATPRRCVRQRPVRRRRRRAPTGGRSTVNVAPLPSPGLAAVIVPPCNSTSVLQIDSPSPSPPLVRVIVASACRNSSNTCDRNPRRDPPPGVGDLDANRVVQPPQPHRHAPAPVGELDGVVQQVPDDLLDPVGVGADLPGAVRRAPLRGGPLSPRPSAGPPRPPTGRPPPGRRPARSAASCRT